MNTEDTKFPFSMYKESGEGRIINSRSHNREMEIVEVTRGSVNVQIGTEFIEAKAGDFLYIPPTMVFRADANGEKATVRGMIFDMSIIEENLDNFDSEIFYMFYVQAKNKNTVFSEGHPTHKSLSAYMREAYEEYIDKDVCYKLPIRACIYKMITLLLRYYCGSRDEEDRMVYHNVLRMRPVLDFIAEHFTEKIYIEKLSDMISVSPDYFTRMFKDSIGKTPIDYINALRINEAMRLLYETDRPMAEIAEAVGFCNANYFHKIFKQYMDVSPLVYRKSSK